MNLFKIACLAAAGIVCSCGGNDKTAVRPDEISDTARVVEQTIRIDLSRAREEFDLGALIDMSDISIIPLETTRECLIGQVDRLFLRQDRLFIFDSQSKGVYVFDKEGKYLCKIQSVGGGPQEYTSITDVFVDDENIYVADSFAWKVQVYDLKCRYVKTLKAEGWSFSGVFTAGDRVYYVNRGIPSKVGSYLLFSTDKDGKDLQKYIPFDEGLQSSLLQNFPYCYISDGRTGLFDDNVEDIVYGVDASGIYPRYRLDFLGRKLPKEHFDKPPTYIIKNGFRSNYVLFPEFIADSGGYLFSQFRMGVDFYSMIYNEKTQETILTKKLFIASIPFDRISLKMSQDGYIVSAMTSYVITASGSYFKEYFEKDSNIANKDVANYFQKKLSQVKEEDNPVVFLYKLKNNR